MRGARGVYALTDVLHIDTSTEWRGGQRQLELLLLARPGDVWAGVPDGALAERIGPPAIALRPGQHPLNIWTLRHAKKWPVVAAHTPHSAMIALLSGQRTVIHRRVDFVPSAWKYRRAEHVIAVSQAVAAIMRRLGVSPERLDIVPDGVLPLLGPADSRWLGSPGPRFGCVGALVPHKGHRVAIEAMTRLPGTLLIAGEGPLRATLSAQIAELGLIGRVQLVGQLEDVAGFLAALDVFVHPSLEEGMGQAVIEAMAAGCRVVASAAGGIPEVVAGAGVLVRSGDADALASSMRSALLLPAGAGVARAAEFSARRMTDATSLVYDKVLLRVNSGFRQTSQ